MWKEQRKGPCSWCVVITRHTHTHTQFLFSWVCVMKHGWATFLLFSLFFSSGLPLKVSSAQCDTTTLPLTDIHMPAMVDIEWWLYCSFNIIFPSFYIVFLEIWEAHAAILTGNYFSCCLNFLPPESQPKPKQHNTKKYVGKFLTFSMCFSLLFL